MAAVIENTIEIARSPEDVFDYLADQGNEIHWNPDCVSMEKLTDGPVGVGTRFRAQWKQGPVIFTSVTAYERPRTWTYENGGMISCVLTCTLEPTADGGTRITARGLWSGHGIARLFFPIFVRTMRKAEVQVLVNARRAMEERRDCATDREVVVVAAVLDAGSEKAAAHRLGLSHSTVKHHLANARTQGGRDDDGAAGVDPRAASA